MLSIRPLLSALLFISSIKAHALSGTETETKALAPQQQNHKSSPTDLNVFQSLLDNVNAEALRPLVSSLKLSEHRANDDATVEALHRDNPSLTADIFKIAKRQDQEAANSSIAVVSTSTVIVTASTPQDTPSSSPTTSDPPVESATTATSIQPLPTIISTSLQPSTSTVTAPPSSTVTTFITTSSPLPTTSNPVIISTPTIVSSPTEVSASSIQSQSSAQGPSSTTDPVSSISPSSSSTVEVQSSPSSDPSSNSESNAQSSTAAPSLVLVTSTLSDGQATTITSYFDAATTSTGNAPSGTQANGSLQTQNSGTTVRPWTFGAIVTFFGIIIAI